MGHGCDFNNLPQYFLKLFCWYFCWTEVCYSISVLILAQLRCDDSLDEVEKCQTQRPHVQLLGMINDITLQQLLSCNVSNVGFLVATKLGQLAAGVEGPRVFVAVKFFEAVPSVLWKRLVAGGEHWRCWDALLRTICLFCLDDKVVSCLYKVGIHSLQTRKGRTQVDEKGFVKPETDHSQKGTWRRVTGVWSSRVMRAWEKTRLPFANSKEWWKRYKCYQMT